MLTLFMEKEKFSLKYFVGIPAVCLAVSIFGRNAYQSPNVKEPVPIVRREVGGDLENVVAVPEIMAVESAIINPNVSKQVYSQEELNEIRNILYAEAANQPRQNRRLIGRTILNRVASEDYPNTIYEVIHQRDAFSCINDKINKNWKQAIGELERNEYEEKVFKRCQEDAEDVLDGNYENIPREKEIIAYHDLSVDIEKLRQKKDYWKGLEEVYRNERLVFYAPKLNSSK